MKAADFKPWIYLTLALGFCAFSLSGRLYRPVDQPSTGFFLALSAAAFLSLIFSAWSLGRARPAPGLRGPWWLALQFALCHGAIQQSGGLASPLFPLLYLPLAFCTQAFFSYRRSIPLVLAILGMEGFSARHQADGTPLRLLALLSPLLGFTLAVAAARIRVPAGPGESGLRSEAGGSSSNRMAWEAPSQELPEFNAQEVLKKSYAALLEMAFHAHPHWNSLMLLWYQEGGFQCRGILSHSPVKQDLSQMPGDGLFGWVLKEQKVLMATKMSVTSATALPYYQEPQRVQSLACLPFFSEGELWGALAFDKLSEDFITQGEIDFIESLSKQIVLITQQAIYGERARAQGQQYSRLHEASRQIGQDLEKDALLRKLPELLSGLVPFDSFYLAMRPGEGDDFVVELAQGYDASFAGNFNAGVRDDLSLWVVNHAEAVLFNAGAQGGSVPAFLSAGMQKAAQSFLLVPLQHAHQVRGLLKLDRAASPGFNDRDREVASIFASQAAATLENARLYTLHRQMATTDGLTGLYNHRYFQERLALELEKAERSGQPLSLALADIDFFKKFNDTFGHQEGDEVLKRVAKMFRELSRTGQDIPCRYGGEEFVFIMPATDLPEASLLANKIREHSAAHLKGGSGPEAKTITLSMGVCSFPMGARDQRQLIHLADQALYKAKQNGRNRVCSFKDLA